MLAKLRLGFHFSLVRSICCINQFSSRGNGGGAFERLLLHSQHLEIRLSLNRGERVLLLFAFEVLECAIQFDLFSAFEVILLGNALNVRLRIQN